MSADEGLTPSEQRVLDVMDPSDHPGDDRPQHDWQGDEPDRLLGHAPYCRSPFSHSWVLSWCTQEYTGASRSGAWHDDHPSGQPWSRPVQP
jgi:hypothetical protein